MRTFLLVFPNDGNGEPKTIAFQGENPSAVFSILEHETSDRSILLMESGKRLGTLERHDDGYWTLN